MAKGKWRLCMRIEDLRSLRRFLRMAAERCKGARAGGGEAGSLLLASRQLQVTGQLGHGFEALRLCVNPALNQDRPFVVMRL
jgi:hypothetical protein